MGFSTHEKSDKSASFDAFVYQVITSRKFLYPPKERKIRLSEVFILRGGSILKHLPQKCGIIFF